MEDAVFNHFVRPKKEITTIITQLTTIDNDMVSSAEEFAYVGDEFIRFMQQTGENENEKDDIVIFPSRYCVTVVVRSSSSFVSNKQ
jgi:DNA polymerase III epsilon subunit-like protein